MRGAHSFSRYESYEPSGLAFPIDRKELIENISAVETQPAAIFPRMIVAKMHRDDESAAAFTSHM